MDRYNGEKLAAPGDPKHLLDVGEEDLLETTDKEFGTILADRLGEEKPELLEGIVVTFGKEVAHKLYKITQKKEVEGGMEINNGARRRTSGGVYLYLFKTDTTVNIDKEVVKKFLADSKKQEDRKFLEAKKRKKEKNFDKEMAEFLDLRKEVVKKKEEGEEEKGMEQDGKEEEEEELEQLDSSSFSKIIGSLKSDRPAIDRLKSFQEPDAPPNSVERVERTLHEYDDDLFS